MKERWILLPDFGSPIQTRKWAPRNWQDTQGSFNATDPNHLGGKQLTFKEKSWQIRKEDARNSQVCRGVGFTASGIAFLLGISANQGGQWGGRSGRNQAKDRSEVDHDQLAGDPFALVEPVKKNDGFLNRVFTLRFFIRWRNNQHTHSKFNSYFQWQWAHLSTRTHPEHGSIIVQIDALYLIQNLLAKLSAHSILLFLESRPTVKLLMQQALRKGVMAKNEHELELVKKYR